MRGLFFFLGYDVCVVLTLERLQKPVFLFAPALLFTISFYAICLICFNYYTSKSMYILFGSGNVHGGRATR
jgi:hypothetical protein